MEDHYKVLGISKTASKQEIKVAFRKLAIQFHPDKHSQSSKSAKDSATLKFKQVSEAYEVLIDDRKRAAYNLSRYSSNDGNYNSSNYYGNHQYKSSSYDRNFYYRSSSTRGNHRFVSNLDAVLRYMTTRSFLLHLAFAGILLGGTIAVDMSGEALWKMKNSGKSFEDAMESIEKNKAHEDKH